MDSKRDFVYSEGVIQFVTTAVRTCLVLEHTGELEKSEYLKQLLRLLPQLYADAQRVEIPEEGDKEGGAFGEEALGGYDAMGYLQQFVTEDDYNEVAMAVKTHFGTDDAYLEVLMDDMRYSDEPITAFLSENLADIYQEMKDLAFNYQTENEEVMYEAVGGVLQSFREHWGQKLLNALRWLHALSLQHEDE